METANTPRRFRKKPVVIEAVQFTGHNSHEIREFVNQYNVIQQQIDHLFIDTLEGRMRADPGDWIIKGVKGEFYPIKNTIFMETYEPVEDVSGLPKE